MLTRDEESAPFDSLSKDNTDSVGTGIGGLLALAISSVIIVAALYAVSPNGAVIVIMIGILALVRIGKE